MSLKAGDWAAWVQAIGSIAAICAGFGTAIWQNKKASRLRELDRSEQERERASRAEVVALRLYGWLSEVGTRIRLRLDTYNNLRWEGGLPQPQSLVEQWKLDVVTGIEGVFNDLHYLQRGSGDVAQLDYHIRYFDAFLDQLNKPFTNARGQHELVQIYKNVGDQLRRMQELHADAERHLDPIVRAAVAKER